MRSSTSACKCRPPPPYCLGIESTADDFSVGILTPQGEVLANIISAYVPVEGGIHPREAARHHAEVARGVLEEAFRKAGVKPREVGVVAFSQGPGLGPCLRTGATAARALASFLEVPLVGVNHCVAHIEIGKLVAEAEDPLTLYVSGGNTIVAAFDAGRYRVFGETLDIAVGNCLDVFAREAGLRQREGVPLGAAVESLATRGETYVPLPYTVKGMDLSFSGLLTAATQVLRSGKHGLEDLCFSLQEVAFSMLTEVTERALAHTEKQEVLLTGGVAANRRLQQMLRVVAGEHGARFCVVPKEYALDNGAMIAWTGLLAHRHGAETPTERSFVRLRWRLEEVPVPWVGRTGRARVGGDTLGRSEGGPTLLKRGAEACLFLEEWHGRRVVMKRRLPKAYRLPWLDREIRTQRTVREPQLLHRAKEAGVPTPTIFMVDVPEANIVMELVEGRQVKQILDGLPAEERRRLCRCMGGLIGRLHHHGVIHGDLTTSNIVLDPQGTLVFIDFGLGELSEELEARGVDLHLMRRALQSTHYRHAGECFRAVLDGYAETLGEAEAGNVLIKVQEIERRGRYVSER